MRELGTGGAEKVLINVANNLDQGHFSVCIAYVEDGSYRVLVGEHVELFQFRSKKPLIVALEIRKLVMLKGYDVVLFSWAKPMVIAQALNLFKNLRVRTVFRVPISLQSQIRFNPFYNNVLFKKFLSRILAKADQLIALCNGMKEELVEHFDLDERKIRVIPNPINVEFVREKASERNPFEGEEDKVRIVAVGRLEYQKGFDILLRAFRLVADKFPNAILTIVGKGSRAGELKTLARKLKMDDRVRFLDWVDNPYPFLKNADVFVLPSRFEGFPNVLLEALACGTKVVAADCPTGPREILGEDEKLGWLAKVEDPISLAEKVIEAIGSPAKPVDEALKRFSLKEAVKAYQDLIHDVIQPKLLVLLSELGGGGAQRVALVVAKHLAGNGTKVALLTLKGGDYRDYLDGSAVETIVLNVPRARGSVFKVLNVLSQFQPDVIFTTLIQDYYVASVASAFSSGKPKIVARLSNDVDVVFKRRLERILGKLVLSRADKIVTQTERMRVALTEKHGVDGRRCVTIWNPVDVAFVREKSLAFDPFADFKVNVKIVSAGRLVFQKGFDILLKAFRIVLNEVPNARLFILGEGPERMNLEALAQELGILHAVNFIGWVANPYPYFRGCDVFVLSSRYEGMPNVLIEALACGSKIVATDCPTGPREIIGSANECGWLVPVESYEELGRAILIALRSEKKVAESCVEKFSAELVVPKYREIIRELTGW